MPLEKKPTARREKIFSKTGGLCRYCGCKLCISKFHVDHIHPTSRGGSNLQFNLAPACPRCNVSKGNKTLEEWRLVLSFRSTHKDAPDMSLKQIQWLVDHSHISIARHSFHFEVSK